MGYLSKSLFGTEMAEDMQALGKMLGNVAQALHKKNRIVNQNDHTLHKTCEIVDVLYQMNDLTGSAM